MTTLLITRAAACVWVDGKFADRENGSNEGDIYDRMRLALEGTGRATLAVTEDDLRELAQELDAMINPLYGFERLIHPETNHDRNLRAALRTMQRRVNTTLSQLGETNDRT